MTYNGGLQSNVWHPAIVELRERHVWNMHGLMTPKGLQARPWRRYQVHDRWYGDRGMTHIHKQVGMMKLGMHLRHSMHCAIGNVVPEIPNVEVLIRPSCGYYEKHHKFTDELA